MDRTYTPAELSEIEKVLKYIRQMEGIIRTSPSPEQKERVKKELKKYTDRLVQLVPSVNPQRINIEGLMKDLGIGEQGGGAGGAGPSGEGNLDMIGRMPVEKASPHSQDPDVNFLSTVLKLIHSEYWPAISDQHAKLDFSHGAERDAIRAQLENSMRNLRVLCETIEEYSMAEKQDFREQLMKMKNKQTRVFLFEANETFKKVREFLRKVNENSAVVILNGEEPIHFNSRFESATILEGRTVTQAVQEFELFLSQCIAKLNLPEFKQRLS